MEAVVVIAYMLVIAYVLAMLWRLVRAVERIADKLDK